MSIREQAINRLGGYSPPLLWWRAKRPIWAWKISSHYGKPTCRYVERNGLTVKRGGFSGLEFPRQSLGHTNYLGAKLAGIYEPPVVDFLATQAPFHKSFVDLGSGDGFFMTGLGRINPGLQLVGYELNPYERDLARQIAGLNQVSAEFRSLADEEELRKLPQDGLLLLCDLEGLEEDLLDPARARQLKNATMVVEAHSQFRPDVVDVLKSRFEDTHVVDYIPAKRCDPETIPELESWPERESAFIVNDGHAEDEGWMTFVRRNVES